MRNAGMARLRCKQLEVRLDCLLRQLREMVILADIAEMTEHV